ncbi:mannosyl-oligosaccharide alpha-1,2-mannosidase-like protein [Polyplosphaeria fusca]|uniref:alpha-1,2-Mannosidase n=1 Tax=Polyplosphaeria fusca TaxID=682080 RepID=A0A9P4QU55_9PLEO|nr:mannosyl-oligosaccharide alpha-1,2-mannosidase-like protein [Polyplosphaeria fusca]
MPSFRRWGKSKFQKNPESSFKLLAAVLVITLYLIIKEFQHPTIRSKAGTTGARIQYVGWNSSHKADADKADKVREAMKYTFWKYRDRAWGYDDVLPVSGEGSNSRNGWGAFIVDSSTTLAVMGLWDELSLCVEHIVKIDFTSAQDLVDPFETTIRYLGALVSLVDLKDAGVIPDNVVGAEARNTILQQAVTLANSLGPAYDTPTGMPWPRVNFNSSQGVGDPPSVYAEQPEKQVYKNPFIGPARTGSSILETRTLTRLTGNSIYVTNSTKAWAPLVWSRWVSPWKGMVDAPIDIITGKPVARQRHWDGGHDSYYEYLLKMTIMSPPSDPYVKDYRTRFLDAAYSLRSHLASRSAPAPDHTTQHLFIGRQDQKWYQNRQGHLACFAPGTILLGAKYLEQPYLQTFAQALLEGCHHTYTSTPSKMGPETWSWIPKFGFDTPVYEPQSDRQVQEWKKYGFWASDPQYKGRPEYVESVFYAWRITGEQRYREWAWEAFQGMERHCKAPYGYAQLTDVFHPLLAEWAENEEGRWIDMQESFWAAETLKYLWLTFADVSLANLDRWVFSTEGHLFRMIR